MKNLVKMPFFRLALLVLVVVILGLLLKKYVANRERFFNDVYCDDYINKVSTFINKPTDEITFHIKINNEMKKLDLKIVEDGSNKPKLQHRIYNENAVEQDKGNFIDTTSLEYKTKKNTTNKLEIESIKVNNTPIDIYRSTKETIQENNGPTSEVCTVDSDKKVTILDDNDSVKSINKLFTYLADFFTLTNDTYEETQLKKFKLYDPEKKPDGTDEDHVSFSIIVKKKDGNTFESKLSKLTFVNKLAKLENNTNVYALKPTFSVHVLDIGSPLVFGTPSTTKGDVTKIDDKTNLLKLENSNNIKFKNVEYKPLTNYGDIIDYINMIVLSTIELNNSQLKAATSFCKYCYKNNGGCVFNRQVLNPVFSSTDQTTLNKIIADLKIINEDLPTRPTNPNQIEATKKYKVENYEPTDNEIIEKWNSDTKYKYNTTTLGCAYLQFKNSPIIFKCNVCGNLTDSPDKATIITSEDRIDNKNISSQFHENNNIFPSEFKDDLMKKFLSLFERNKNYTLDNTKKMSEGNLLQLINKALSGSRSTSGSTSGSTGTNNYPSTFSGSLNHLSKIMNQKLAENTISVSGNEVKSSMNVVDKLEKILSDAELEEINTFRNFSYDGSINTPVPFDSSYKSQTGSSNQSELNNYKNYRNYL